MTLIIVLLSAIASSMYISYLYSKYMRKKINLKNMSREEYLDFAVNSPREFLLSCFMIVAILFVQTIPSSLDNYSFLWFSLQLILTLLFTIPFYYLWKSIWFNKF